MSGKRISFKKLEGSRQQYKSLSEKDIYKSIFNLARDAITINELPSSDRKGEFIIVNKAACKTFGYSKRELLKMSVFDLIDKKTKENSIPSLINKLQKKRKGRFTITIIKKSGKKVPVEINVILIIYKGRYVAHSVIRDISKQTRMDEKLTRKIEEINNSRQQIKTILDNILDTVIVLDARGNYVYTNKISNKSNVLSQFKVNHRKGWRNIFIKFISKYEVYFENGEVLRLENTPVLRALKGKKTDDVIRIVDKKTQKRRWFMMRARPLFNKDGTIRMVVTIYTDITQKRETEFYKDEFINLASHELKTPLTSLKVYGQILQKKIMEKNYTGLLNICGNFNNQIHLLENYVSDYLDSNKIQSGKINLQLKTEDIQNIITEVCRDLQNICSSHKLITTSIHQKVLVDKDKIRQVLSNLIINAVKYSPNADKIYIRVRNENNTIIINVKDLGIGIPGEYQDKIFDRFWQVKNKKRENFEGLGLGLYITKGIVESHGGSIWVTSEPGKGSTFSFTIPVKH